MRTSHAQLLRLWADPCLAKGSHLSDKLDLGLKNQHSSGFAHSSWQGSFLGPCTPSTKLAVPFSLSEKRGIKDHQPATQIKRTLRPGSSGISIPLCGSSWASIADYRANPGRSCSAIRSKGSGGWWAPAEIHSSYHRKLIHSRAWVTREVFFFPWNCGNCFPLFCYRIR